MSLALPSVPTIVPRTSAVLRRSDRAGVDSERCAVGQEEREHRCRDRGDVELLVLCVVAGQHRERTPRCSEHEVGVQATAEQLEVVADGQDDSDSDERDQRQADAGDADHADDRCTADADGRRGDRARVRGSTWPVVVRGARRARGRRYRPRGRRREASRRAVRRRPDPRDMPRSRRTRGATTCTEDAAGSTNRARPAARRTPVGRRTPERSAVAGSAARCSRSCQPGDQIVSSGAPAPHDQTSAEAHPAGPDIVDAGVLPGRDRPVDGVLAVVGVDARTEEAADLEPGAAAGDRTRRSEG